MLRFGVAWFVLGTLVSVTPEASANGPATRFLRDRFVVELSPLASRTAFRERARAGPLGVTGVTAVDALASRFGAAIEPEFAGEIPPPGGSTEPDFAAFQVVRLRSEADLDPALVAFASLREVIRVHRIPLVEVMAVPNDSLWSRAWHLDQEGGPDIGAIEAWSIERGDSASVIAIIDSGVLPYHPDLGGVVAGGYGNIWSNPGEISGLPGVDDDRNFLVDDVHGWDFVDAPDSQTMPTPGEDGWGADNDPNDFPGHGTIVAGLAAALPDNGIGTAGLGWDTRILPLRVVWSAVNYPGGVTTMSHITQALRYATRMQADVVNISLSTVFYAEFDLAVRSALNSGVVIVAPAGNNNSPNLLALYPEVITVGASDRYDVVPQWSDRSLHVDLVAPGVEVPSTVVKRPGGDSLATRQPGYVPDASGTSFSAPLVAATAALVEARRRHLGLSRLRPAEVRDLVTHATDDIRASNPGLLGYGSGRLNAARTVDRAGRLHLRSIAGSSAGPNTHFATENGQARIAFMRSDGRLVLLDGETLDIVATTLAPAVTRHGLAAADLGGPHGAALFVALEGGSIAGFGPGGSPLPGWPVSAGTTPPPRFVGTPVLGDLDGDGLLEIVVVGATGEIWCWRPNGTVLPGTPFVLTAGTAVAAPPALSDLDGIAGVEIIVAGADGTIHALRGDGTALPGWPVLTGESDAAGPVVTMAGTEPRIIVTGRRNVLGLSPAGTVLFRTPRPSLVPPLDPALADLDLDGTDEIIVATESGVEVYRLDGSPFSPEVWPLFPTWRSTGPPLVGHLSGAGPPEILVPSAEGYQTLDAAGRPAADVNLFPDITPYPTISRHGTQDVTRILGAATTSDRFHAYDAGNASWSDEPQPWPTHRGNFARTGSHPHTPGIAGVDTEPPATVADLAAAALTATTARLSWTAPGDGGRAGRAAAYEIRYVLPFESGPGGYQVVLPVEFAPGQAGMPETLVVRGLTPSSTVQFTLTSLDFAGNPSAVSNPAPANLPSRTPAPVQDLRVSNTTDSSLALAWTATGEDGRLGRTKRYVIRWSFEPPSLGSLPTYPSTIVTATVDAGGVESWTLAPLPRGIEVWLTIQAFDHEERGSAISNVAHAITDVGPTVSAEGPPALRVAGQPGPPPLVFHWRRAEPDPRFPRTIRIHDLAGRLRRVLVAGTTPGGITSWDGDDAEGRPLPAGVYLATLQGHEREAGTRVVLLR